MKRFQPLSRPHFLPILAALSLLTLVACSNLSSPEPAGTVDSLAVTTASGVAFLPPVGRATDTSGFFAGADLRIEIYALEGATPTGPALAPSFSTADGSIRVRRRFYRANWRVAETRAVSSAARVRVEVRTAGAGPGPSCIDPGSVVDPSSGCLGFFDAQLTTPGNRGRTTSGNRGRGRNDSGILDLVNTRTLPIKVYLEGNRPTRIEDLYPDVDGRNCPVHEFNLPGQGLRALGAGLRALGAGLRAVGAVGGLFLLEPGGSSAGDTIVRLVEPAEVGGWAAAIPNGAPTPQQNAAILVVDDFGPPGSDPIYTLDPGFFDPGGTLTLAQLEALVAGGRFSHGALVMHHIVATLAGAGFDLEKPTPATSGAFRIFTRSADAGLPQHARRSVMVAAVDTEGLDTDVISARIENALAALNYYNSELDLDTFQVAINMSFAIVPCVVLDDFEASNALTFEDYVAALGADHQIAEEFYDELAILLLTPLGVEAEPLLDRIEACSAGPSEGDPSPLPDSGFIPWADLVRSPEAFDVPPWDTCAVPSGVSVIDFEDALAAGDIVAAVSKGAGISGFDAGGSIGVGGDNPILPGQNAAMIFDATCGGGTAIDCSGGEADLFRPELGNILIVSKDLDGDDPDDSPFSSNVLRFDFTSWGAGDVDVASVLMNVIDIDASQAGGLIDLYSGGPGGDLLRSLEVPITGNNGVGTVVLDLEEAGIDYMEVRLKGSGAIDNIAFSAERSTRPSIIYVGSAGNFGLSFPLYPAAWPLVLSSASQDAAEPAGYQPERSSFSNSGEVLAPGALFELSRDGSGVPQWAISYAGTSFSAPVHSVHTALDLMRNAPLCGLSDRSRLAHGEPFDVALPDAVAAYCLPPGP